MHRVKLVHLLLSIASCVSIVPGAAQEMAISVCAGSTASAGAETYWDYYAANGAPHQIIVSRDPPAIPACDTAILPVAESALLWAAPLPDYQDSAEINRLALQGSFATGGVNISEIIGNEPQAAAGSLPVIGRNLLQDFDVLQFGVEERAVWSNNTLTCAAGSRTAGLQLQSRLQWPMHMRLQITAFGEGEFAVAIADRQRMDNEATLELGVIALQGADTASQNTFNLPANAAPWEALTLLCPPTAAEINIDSIVLKPLGASSRADRSAWVWNARTWLEDPEFFWTLQGLEDLTGFYISVPVSVTGTIEQQQALRRFVRAASTRNVKIWAVIGDRHDVLPESLPAMHMRISAYRNYNEQAAPEEKLAGIQLDIEPYLMPGHNLATEYWRERYLETIRAAREYAGADMALDLVMPVWWGSHPSWGQHLLDALIMPNISLTIMNYRTRYEQLLSGALPFLNWGITQQQPVRMALETGSLDNETQRIYASSALVGELWSIEIGNTPVLLLFDGPQSNLPGRAWSQQEQRQFSAGNLTFAGNQLQLNTMLERLVDEWRDWPSFAGVAIHGLDEVYSRQ